MLFYLVCFWWEFSSHSNIFLLYIWCVFFSGCFYNFLLIAGFQQFDYDVSGWFLVFCVFILLRFLEIFWQLFLYVIFFFYHHLLPCLFYLHEYFCRLRFSVGWFCCCCCCCFILFPLCALTQIVSSLLVYFFFSLSSSSEISFHLLKISPL